MKNLIYAIVGISIVVSVIYAFSGGESDEAYTLRISKMRKERLRFLENADDSPFRTHPEGVDSLSFYPITKAYAVSASAVLLEEKKYMSLRTNTGENQKYQKYGYAHFELLGVVCKLMLLRPIGEKKLLLAFADETSGSDTYGGGRYIDLPLTQTENIEIDFNLAYNPYCAYNSAYSCPLPPKDNVLPISILAGEKKP